MPTFPCSNCGQHIEADDSYIGTKVACPTCASQMVVPDGSVVIPRGPGLIARLTSSQLLPIAALVIALLSLILHFRGLIRVGLDFDTPESAIRSIVKLNRSGDYADMKRAENLMRDELSWRHVRPSTLKIEKTLEVKGTGDKDADGGALCFLRFKKEDGVDSHVVVLLTKNSDGRFVPGYISSSVRDDYGSVIKAWEKDGSLK